MTSDLAGKKRLGGTGKDQSHNNPLTFMKKLDKPVRGIDWRAIFAARPDLDPPSYSSLLTQIRKEQTNEQDD